jgi:hypothetical protein
MATVHLKYYARRKQLNAPINGLKEELIDIILAAQAKDLTERAKKALGQVAEGVDGAAILNPHVSTYSMTSRNGLGSTDNSSPADRVGVASDPHAPPSPVLSTGSKRTREVSPDLMGLVTFYLG